MTTRVLPRSEWARLAGTEVGPIAEALPPDVGQVIVVEDGGQIVATWALIPMLHAEGLWIADGYRGRVGVVRRLLRGMRELAAGFGVGTVQTAAVSTEVAAYIGRLGGSPLPGQAFLLPLKG